MASDSNHDLGYENFCYQISEDLKSEPDGVKGGYRNLL